MLLNSQVIKVQYLGFNGSIFLLQPFSIYFLFFAYQLIVWHIPSLITFSNINNISGSVHMSNFALFSFKTSCYGSPGGEETWAGSSLYVLRHIFWKF